MPSKAPEGMIQQYGLFKISSACPHAGGQTTKLIKAFPRRQEALNHATEVVKHVRHPLNKLYVILPVLSKAPAVPAVPAESAADTE